MDGILVSMHRCNKSPLINWLRTTQIYSLTVLEVWNLKWISWAKIKILVGLCYIWRKLEENLFSCLFQLLEATHTRWPLSLSSKPAALHLRIPLCLWLLLSWYPLSHLRIQWLYCAHADNAVLSSYLKVTRLTTLILSAILIPPCLEA